MSKRTVSWDDIPDQTLLPEGVYPVRIESIEEGETRGGPEAKLQAGCYQVQVQYRILKHPAVREFESLAIWDRFTLGTNDDPNFEDPATHAASISAKQLKRMLRAADTPLDPDFVKTFKAAEGRELEVRVAIRKTKDDTELNDVKGYYPSGEKKIGVKRDGKAEARRSTGARLPAPQPAGAAAGGDDQLPAPARGGRGGTNGKAASAGAGTAEGGTATATKPRVRIVVCEECDEEVLAKEYSTHMRTEHSDL